MRMTTITIVNRSSLPDAVVANLLPAPQAQVAEDFGPA
jgi:hypothetical protein